MVDYFNDFFLEGALYITWTPIFEVTFSHFSIFQPIEFLWWIFFVFANFFERLKLFKGEFQVIRVDK